MNRIGLWLMAGALALLAGCATPSCPSCGTDAAYRPFAVATPVAGAAAGGCSLATAPVMQASVFQTQVNAAPVPCASCRPEERQALAVARAGACNDFPVTYRVQVPETNARIRYVERLTLH